MIFFIDFFRYKISVRYSIVILCVFFISSCAFNAKNKTLDANVDLQSSYVLSEHYENHRAQQKKFLSSGGHIAYTDHGEGKTLVMLHGVPSSSWLYRKMIPQLQNNFRVITIDLLGYGSSDKPKASDKNYTFEQQAIYVQELLSALNVDRFGLLVHDMGGLVGWEIIGESMRKNISQVSHLVLLNTIIAKQGFNHPKYEKGMMAKQMTKAYASNFSSAAILKMTFNHMGLSDNASLSEQECRGYVVPMKEGSDEALYEFFTGFNQSLFDRLNQNVQTLKNFSGDILVMWGAKDEVLTTSQLPVLKQAVAIPEENIHIFKSQSHFLPEEIPQKLNMHIVEFFDK